MGAFSSNFKNSSHIKYKTLMKHDLSRYLEAQESSYMQALAEIKSGKKRSHWMWYIFPQFKGLGISDTSRHYAINDLHEAKSYLNHPILGYRLKQISNELLLLGENNATNIFGKPDDLKLHSSMTLFATVDTSEEQTFNKVLAKFFNGQTDNKTLILIKS
jgi:uncharacterized protein (DUF1810 family)